MAESRKVAAILVADIVGYSRLTAADEEGTLARLRALRIDFIDPTIAAHNGRLVKRTGDGAIIEFRSVVEAVRCAIEVRNGFTERDAGLPDGQRIVARVGIHLGDVVEEADGDLMGDGSTSRLGSKEFATRARSRCRKMRIAKCATKSTKLSPTWASKTSRTSLAR